MIRTTTDNLLLVIVSALVWGIPVMAQNSTPADSKPKANLIFMHARKPRAAAEAEHLRAYK